MASCCACGKSIGVFTGKKALKDGYICNRCMKVANLDNVLALDDIDLSEKYAGEVAKFVKKQKEIGSLFSPSLICGKLALDRSSHTFKLNKYYFTYSNLHSYAYFEDPIPEALRAPETNRKAGGAAIGGVIGGIHGGIIGGAIGAAVGHTIGSLISPSCNKMYIDIYLKGTLRNKINLTFITEKTRTNSPEYLTAVRRANETMEGLRIIDAYNSDALAKALDSPRIKVVTREKQLSASEAAEELMVYKQLFYSGDMTQEEYDQKRREVLGLH